MTLVIPIKRERKKQCWWFLSLLTKTDVQKNSRIPLICERRSACLIITNAIPTLSFRLSWLAMYEGCPISTRICISVDTKRSVWSHVCVKLLLLLLLVKRRTAEELDTNVRWRCLSVTMAATLSVQFEQRSFFGKHHSFDVKHHYGNKCFCGQH